MRKQPSPRRDRNDFYRSVAPLPPLSGFAEGEGRIRGDLRKLVAGEMKYLEKGNRGAGRTIPSILARIRFARRQHSASIRRQLDWASA